MPLISDAAIPNLAGHSAAAVYKQLEDIKDNRRDAAVTVVAPLSQQHVLDLAAHHAAMPNPRGTGGAGRTRRRRR